MIIINLDQHETHEDVIHLIQFKITTKYKMNKLFFFVHHQIYIYFILMFFYDSIEKKKEQISTFKHSIYSDNV
jgi:hypothetical protein